VRCNACGFAPIGDFPSFVSFCFADTNALVAPLENVASELGKVPNTETGNRAIVIYVCPHCGALRANIKQTK